MQQRLRKRCIIKLKSRGVERTSLCDKHHCILDMTNSASTLSYSAITTTATFFLLSMNLPNTPFKLISGMVGLAQIAQGAGTVDNYHQKVLKEKVISLETKLEGAMELIAIQNRTINQETKNVTQKEKKEKVTKPMNMHDLALLVAICLLTACMVELMALVFMGGHLCGKLNSDNNNNNKRSPRGYPDQELLEFRNPYYRIPHQDSPPIHRPNTLHLNKGETGARRREKTAPGAHPLLIGGKSPEAIRRYCAAGAAGGEGEGSSTDPVKLA
jgi:hypothetical protein